MAKEFFDFLSVIDSAGKLAQGFHAKQAHPFLVHDRGDYIGGTRVPGFRQCGAERPAVVVVLSILDQADQILGDGRRGIVPDPHAQLVVPDIIVLEALDQPLRDKAALGFENPTVGKKGIDVAAANRLGPFAQFHQCLNRRPR